MAPVRRLHALLSSPDAAIKVARMPVQDIALLIAQVGLADAVELVGLATPDQIQRVVDIDVWDRDEIDIRRYGEWLEVLLSAKGEDAVKSLRGMDPEPLLYYFRRYIRIHLAEDEERSEAEKLRLEALDLVKSPDDLFLIEFVDQDEPLRDFILATLQRLYTLDLEFSRWLMMSLHAVLPTVILEAAYRIRTGRVEELGFLEREDALSVYQPLRADQYEKPFPSVHEDLTHSVPLPVPSSLIRGAPGTLLSRALEISAARRETDAVERGIMHLTNKVLAAEQVPFRQWERIVDTMRRVRGILDIGLALEAGDDPRRAASLLEDVHPEWIFRRGFTPIALLARRASALVEAMRRKVGGRLPVAAEPPYDEVLVALTMNPPHCALQIVSPAEGGVEPFSSLEQVRRCEEVLAEIEHALRFILDDLAWHPVSIEKLEAALAFQKRALSAEGILMTCVARSLLDGDMRLDPLNEEELARLIQSAFEGGAAPGMLRAMKPEVEARVLASAPDDDEGLHAFVRRGLDAFRDAYGALPAHPLDDLRMAGGPVYLLPSQS